MKLEVLDNTALPKEPVVRLNLTLTKFEGELLRATLRTAKTEAGEWLRTKLYHLYSQFDEVFPCVSRVAGQGGGRVRCNLKEEPK